MFLFQRVEPQQSPNKYVEKAIGSPNAPTTVEVKTENGRVSSIVNAINNNSMRGRIPKSSSKDDLLKEVESAAQDVLNCSTNSVSSTFNLRSDRIKCKDEKFFLCHDLQCI